MLSTSLLDASKVKLGTGLSIPDVMQLVVSHMFPFSNKLNIWNEDGDPTHLLPMFLLWDLK